VRRGAERHMLRGEWTMRGWLHESEARCSNLLFTQPIGWRHRDGQPTRERRIDNYDTRRSTQGTHAEMTSIVERCEPMFIPYIPPCRFSLFRANSRSNSSCVEPASVSISNAVARSTGSKGREAARGDRRGGDPTTPKPTRPDRSCIAHGAWMVGRVSCLVASRAAFAVESGVHSKSDGDASPRGQRMTSADDARRSCAHAHAHDRHI
jgi:hypothetical protein